MRKRVASYLILAIGVVLIASSVIFALVLSNLL